MINKQDINVFLVRMQKVMSASKLSAFVARDNSIGTSYLYPHSPYVGAPCKAPELFFVPQLPALQGDHK